jgi:hypothetical protein
MIMTRFRSTIGAILVVALPLHLSSCSQVKQVPIKQVGSGKKDYKTPYRLHTSDGAVYITRHFVVTDSTFVIKSLSPSDVRYEKATLPLTIPATDIVRIEKSEAGFGTYAVFVVIGLLAIAVTAGSAWAMD